VKPNRIQRKIYRRKSAHTSMSPMPGVLEKPTTGSSKRRKNNKKLQQSKGNPNMNCICLSPDQITAALPVLGLDVAKRSVQAELRTSGKRVRFGFANNTKGFAQLACLLKEHNVLKVWAGLEATGPYSQALALWLYGQGHRVSLLNPRRVQQYARSAGNRNKTDELDAAIIADFICAHEPASWRPPAVEVAQLQALVRRREELSVMLQSEKNRLEGVAPNVRCSLRRIIDALSSEKARLEKLIEQQIRSHQQLLRDHQLLCTIKGIGSLTAAILLAEMARPGQVERARQAAAHAGLAPRRQVSGSSVRRNRGLAKEGNRYLRKALYMPALVAIKYNVPLRHFASPLRAVGKPNMSIVCAVMRKLIHIAFGVLKHQTPFNPSLV
jgi:transposase